MDLEFVNVKAEIPLPKSAGSVTVDFSKLSPEVRERMLIHGATQKIADIAAGVFVRDEMKREPKDGDVIRDTPEELAKFLREKAEDMVKAWYEGAWTVARSSMPRDPVLAEKWAIIFGAMGVKSKDMPKWREEGIRKAVLAFAEARSGKKIPAKRADAVFAHVDGTLTEKAAANVAARAKAADIDISDLL
jgi:hypothetical protein